MFVVIYRWKLKQGQESNFKEAWRPATQAIYTSRGSLGSQLMQAADGTYYAVAMWPNRELWANRSVPGPADPEASRIMGELTESAFPPVELEVSDDLLALEPFI
jgi:hypothetical protein